MTQGVIFKIVDGKHYCYYSEDGNLQAAFNNNTAEQYLIKDGANDYVMDLDYDETYFKIGNYTQSNPDKEGSDTGDPDNYGEVWVYDFWVSHSWLNKPHIGPKGLTPCILLLSEFVSLALFKF